MRCWARTDNTGSPCQNTCKFIYCNRHKGRWRSRVFPALVDFLGIMIALVLPFWTLSSDEPVVHEIPTNTFKPIFQNDDNFNILIIRFEDYIAEKDTECIGRSIQENLNILKAKKAELRLNIEYVADSIDPPRTKEQATQIRRRHNADLILYGLAQNIEENCQGADLCFRFGLEPKIKSKLSPAIDIKIDKHDDKYVYASPMEIELGKVSFDAVALPIWITALAKINKGENYEAFIELDRFATDPSLSKIERADRLIEIGQTFDEYGSLDKAISTYDELLKYKPEISDASYGHCLKSEIYHKMGHHLLTKLEADSCVAYDPYLTIGYRLRALAYSGQKMFLKAMPEVDKLVMLDSMNSSNVILKAIVYWQLDSLSIAEKNLRKVIKITQNTDPYPYVNLAQVLRQRNKMKESVKYINKAINISPNISNLYLERGKTYLFQNKPMLAILDFDKAQKLDPKNARVYGLCGTLFMNNGNYDQAIIEFDKAIDLEPKNPRHYTGKGLAQLGISDIFMAVDNFNKAISLDGEDPDNFIFRALAFRDLQFDKLANEDVNRALNLDSLHIDALNLKSYIHISNGRLEEARRILRIADRTHGVDLSTAITWACYYTRIEDWEKAMFFLNFGFESGIPIYDILNERLLTPLLITEEFKTFAEQEHVKNAIKEATSFSLNSHYLIKN